MSGHSIYYVAHEQAKFDFTNIYSNINIIIILIDSNFFVGIRKEDVDSDYSLSTGKNYVATLNLCSNVHSM